jgi:hypothetical protein
VYEAVRLARFSDEQSIASLLGAYPDLVRKLEDVYAAILEDVHRRGIFAVNAFRAALFELSKLDLSAADQLREKNSALKKMQARIKDINAGLATLDFELSDFRARMRALFAS